MPRPPVSQPRSTHDIDFVVQVGPHHVAAIVAAFSPPRYYLSEPAVREALARPGMFNLVDTQEGDNVDFGVLTDEPFDQSRFARRQSEDVLGIRVAVSSAEDTILAKLRWAKLSGGEAKNNGSTPFASMKSSTVCSISTTLTIESGSWRSMICGPNCCSGGAVAAVAGPVGGLAGHLPPRAM